MLNRWTEFVTLLSIIFGVLSATSVASAPSSDLVSDQTRILSAGGRYLLEYRTQPSPLVLNQPFDLFVRVRERYKHKQSPAKNVSLEVD